MRHITLIITLFTTIFLLSCREESIIDRVTKNGETITGLHKNDVVAKLMQRVSLNDGSYDNIIDSANCFNVVLPVVVNINDTEVTVTNKEDIEGIKNIFQQLHNNNTDINLKINFPIIIQLNNFEKVTINNISELDNFRNACNGSDEIDDDIECLNFNFPIEILVFDLVTEQTIDLTINNDQEMHTFLTDLDIDDVVSIGFPISVTASDGSSIQIDSLGQLEITINTWQSNCDEDDNFDFIDICSNCSQNALEILLTNCVDWTVDELELDDNDLEDNYEGFVFNFLSDGTITVQDGENSHTGTWTSSTSGTDIRMVIDIPTLPNFNADWQVYELKNDDDEREVDLRLSNDDELRFESNCN